MPPLIFKKLVIFKSKGAFLEYGGVASIKNVGDVYKRNLN